MNQEEEKRLVWVKLYEQTKDAGLTCRRCGISRPTLRKWSRRYQAQGEAGLCSQSCRPISSPLKKVDGQTEALILGLRKKRKLGPKRLRSDLGWLHSISLSVSVIHKVLRRNDCKPLAKPTRKKAEYIRYCRPIPGERVHTGDATISKGCSTLSGFSPHFLQIWKTGRDVYRFYTSGLGLCLN